MTDVHFHFHFPQADNTEVLNAITQLKESIAMDNQAAADAIAAVATQLGGLATQLTAVDAQLDKATNEIVLAIQNAGAVSPAVETAIGNLQAAAAALKAPVDTATAAAKTLDDLNPDPAPTA